MNSSLRFLLQCDLLEGSDGSDFTFVQLCLASFHGWPVETLTRSVLEMEKSLF